MKGCFEVYFRIEISAGGTHILWHAYGALKYLVFSWQNVDKDPLFDYAKKSVRIYLVAFQKPVISSPYLQKPAFGAYRHPEYYCAYTNSAIQSLHIINPLKTKLICFI
jgi:hypothetical protein